MDAIEHIINNISQGDEDSFKILFNIYKKGIYSYLKSFVKINEIAEELTSDVFLKIWQKREELVNIENFEAYLITIARNKALDFLKMAARDKKVQNLIEEHFFNDEFQRSQPSISAILEQRESVQIILKDLTKQRRNILTLSHIEGYTHEEISNQLKISKNTVKNTIVQTLKALRNLNHSSEIETCWIIAVLFLKNF